MIDYKTKKQSKKQKKTPEQNVLFTQERRWCTLRAMPSNDVIAITDEELFL